MTLKAPFPWFGGKSRVTHLVWERFGDVRNYVEPFAGSLAVLLGRPTEPHTETVNDADGYICNFWRAVASDPDEVARFTDWPVNEADLHPRHAWLLEQRADLCERVMGDPNYCDAKIAGWWVWGLSQWLGSGWCSGNGKWVRQNGRLVESSNGISRQIPQLNNAGMGVHRKRPHLGDGGRVDLSALCSRLRGVRVCCGDFSRVLGPSVTFKHGITGVFLDPPYSTEERATSLYAVDSETVAAKSREWAIENGDNPLLRVALCGYEGEYQMPDTWECVPWKSTGGYGSQGSGRGRENSARERIWFSPACLNSKQQSLFGASSAANSSEHRTDADLEQGTNSI